jgi:hypothetical protein
MKTSRFLASLQDAVAFSVFSGGGDRCAVLPPATAPASLRLAPGGAAAFRRSLPLNHWGGLLRLLALGAAMMTAAALPAFAQSAASAPAGPVHLPDGYATNAPATAPISIAPAASLAGPPPSTNAPAATAPVVSAPVATASDNDDGDIHDIRGVISVPYPLMWLLYLVGGVVLAVALYYLWKWLRRTVIKPKLPHEIALERLEAARALMNEGQVREYAFAVSEVIRNYIEQRFGERARRRTTEEFLSDLLRQTGTPLAEHRALLEDFLNHCDLPKFARWQLSVPEMESMHESARAFISNTRPDVHARAAVPPPRPVQPEPVPAK